MAHEWHALSASKVLEAIDSRPSGLSEDEAKRRITTTGPNRLEAKKKKSALILFLRQFLSPLIYVLLGAAVLSLVLAHYMDAGVVLGVLLLNAIIGFLQEQQAAKAMESLVRMTAPKAQVRRDATAMTIPVEEIVPGDIILLESGNRVPADARVIEEANLKVIEASLTGESTSVDKEVDPLPAETTIAERNNMVFMGTSVTHGRAAAVVVSTGMATQMGSIATALRDVEDEKTPVEKSIATLSRYIVVLVLGVVAALAAVGLYRGMDPVEIVFLAVAAAVSAIPEGLPAVVTVVLALGMRLMAKRNAIVRRLVAVETLGSATVICSDKTGTLTMNEMTVRRLYADGQFVDVTGEGYTPDGQFLVDGAALTPGEGSALRLLLLAGTLCNEATLSKRGTRYEMIGDPTEGALVVAAAKAGIDKESLVHRLHRTCEIPFESEQQYMAVGYEDNSRSRLYVKGSVEKVLSFCGSVLRDGEAAPLDDTAIEGVQQATEQLASRAMRVIALAYLEIPTSPNKLKCAHFQGRLTFLGLAGMADPPREEARQAVRQCRDAGIRVIMITGDHRLTAEAIARQLDLPEGRAIEGKELQKLSDDELAREIDGISVFARIEPLHKLRIVDALKAQGHVVAMTGDGVNDAPALKTANIGIAMGITGTDVAKESADMVLADDNFASVVAAVEEGRAIFSRLRSVVFFLLSTNLGELVGLILAVALVGKAPLLAVQIIWVNLVTDTASAIPLGLEPKSGDELSQPPRHPRVGLLYPGNLLRIIFLSSMMGAGVYLVFNWAQSRMPIEEARTLAFCTMVSFEWFRVFNARSDERTLVSLGLFTNRILLASITVAVLLHLAVVYLPVGQAAFQTVPLSIEQWGIALAAAGSLFLAEELRKLVAPRLFSWGKWQPVRSGNRHAPG
jgi:P-type Ca2+ transporter type 2C